VSDSLRDLRDIAPKPQPRPAGPIAKPAPRIKPKKGLNKINRKRREKRMAETFGVCSRMARLLKCAVPNCEKRWPTHQLQAAHVVSRGAGGSDWANCVGLCADHHAEQHAIGIASFQKRHNVDLLVVASYVADAARNHICSERVETHRSATRCAVCHVAVDEREVTP
jgi:hypothetical protein